MTTTTTPVLPTEFADLEPFVRFAGGTEHERWTVRMGSSMDELQAFYDVALPRIDDACAHIDQWPLDDLPEPAQKLLWLFCSLVSVSFAVEAWRQPYVPDSGASTIDCVRDFPY